MEPERGGDPLPVAAFDLDGTLAEGRSTARFALQLAGPPALAAAVARGALTGGVPPSRTTLKASILRGVLAGRPIGDVRTRAKRFAAEVAAHRLHDDVVDHARVHRAMGHRLVLVTAALDVFADPLAELLGFDDVLATEVEVEQGICTGALRHTDMHGAGKVERLRTWLGADDGATTVFAYGNSSDDDDLLAYAKRTQRCGAAGSPS